MKKPNLEAMELAIAKLLPIPADEGFTEETLELAKLVHKLIRYSEEVKAKSLEQKKPQPAK